MKREWISHWGGVHYHSREPTSDPGVFRCESICIKPEMQTRVVWPGEFEAEYRTALQRNTGAKVPKKTGKHFE